MLEKKQDEVLQTEQKLKLLRTTTFRNHKRNQVAPSGTSSD